MQKVSFETFFVSLMLFHEKYLKPFFFTAFAVNIATHSLAQTIPQALSTFVQEESLSNASISFHVIDLQNDSTLAEYNAKQTLTPASTTKLFATASSYELLGANYSPKTRIYYRGTIDKQGILNGDILLRGGGDPTLGSRYFNTDSTKNNFLSEWVVAIKQVGITRINGTIIADASSFGYDGAPKGWNWGDMGNYYGAAPNGLTVFDNMISLYFSTGKAGQLSHLDSIRPEIPHLAIHNRVVASSQISSDQSYVYGAPYSYDWYVKGELPDYQSNFRVKAAMPDPELFTAIALKTMLADSGITMSQEPTSVHLLEKKINYDSTQLILSYGNSSVKDIVFFTNQKSVNLFAEQLLCLIAYKKGNIGSTENGLSHEKYFWKSRINTSGLELEDGSGLSQSNAISSYHFTQLLSYMHKKNNGWEGSLPIAGKSGTLKNICQNQAGEGRIVAKSGTMERVKSYAGYVYTRSGKKLAFALIVNNFRGSSSSLVDKMERLFNAMAMQ